MSCCLGLPGGDQTLREPRKRRRLAEKQIRYSLGGNESEKQITRFSIQTQVLFVVSLVARRRFHVAIEDEGNARMRSHTVRGRISTMRNGPRDVVKTVTRCDSLKRIAA